MPFVRLDRLFHSTSARLATIYAALMIVAFLSAGVAVWVATRSAAERQIRERVQFEMSALQQEIRIEGMGAAIAAIHTRSESPGALEYRLVAPDGGAIVDDLDIGELKLGWNVVDLPASDPSEEDLLVLVERTPDGGLLAIGDDLAHAERVRDAVLRSIFLIGAVAMLLVMGAGLLAARGALRRMDALSGVLTRVGAGDLSARAPERTGGDDLDLIGRGVNTMLTRIDTLVANVRRVSTDIAHDLRTPLTHARQQLEVGADSVDLATAHAAIRTAQGKIDDILRTFTAMLRLAEIESSATRERFGPVDLSAVLERVVDAYRPDIETTGRFVTIVGDDAIIVQGDSDLIAQAIANLLENALRYTPPGAVIKTSATGQGGAIRLEIADNGPGIPAQDRARATAPFVRLDPSRSSPGAGLGLSIVSAIARLHGAELRLEDNAPGLRAAMVWAASH